MISILLSANLNATLQTLQTLRRGLAILLLLTAGLLSTQDAWAHSQGVSYSSWTLGEQGVQASLRMRQLDLTRLQLIPQQSHYLDELAALVTRTVVVADAQNQPCSPSNFKAVVDGEGWITLSAYWDCSVGSQAPAAIQFGLMFDQAPNHVNMASITRQEGSTVSLAFTDGRRDWRIDQTDAAAPSSSSGFFALGVSHILTGWDHLLFLAVLLLGLSSPRLILWQVTGFTLGHSLTLAAATAGWVFAESAAVEWMIAMSILFVVLENAWRKQSQQLAIPVAAALMLLAAGTATGILHWAAAAGLLVFAVCYGQLLNRAQASAGLSIWITALFGLFHGFGFAGILSEIEIPKDDFWLVLLQFNLGVEAGQLLTLAAVWPVLWAIKKWQAGALDWINALAGGMATFWLISRTF